MSRIIISPDGFLISCDMHLEIFLSLIRLKMVCIEIFFEILGDGNMQIEAEQVRGGLRDPSYFGDLVCPTEFMIMFQISTYV